MEREGLLRKEITKAGNDKKLLTAYIPQMVSVAVCASLTSALASSKRNLRDVIAGMVFKKDDGSSNSNFKDYLRANIARARDRHEAIDRGEVFGKDEELDLYEAYGLKKIQYSLGSRGPQTVFMAALVGLQKHRHFSLILGGVRKNELR